MEIDQIDLSKEQNSIETRLESFIKSLADNNENRVDDLIIDLKNSDITKINKFLEESSRVSKLEEMTSELAGIFNSNALDELD